MTVRMHYKEVLASLGNPVKDGSIAVALIDSGVQSEHPLVGDVTESVEITCNAQGDVSIVPVSNDMLGHGTACAMVIRTYCPRARIYSIRIFKEELKAPLEILEKALYYALKRRVHLINLSIDVTQKEKREQFDKLCYLAERQGIVVTKSSAGHPCETSWNTRSIFTVQADEECQWGEFLIQPTPVLYIRAHPFSVHLPGVNSKNHFYGDSIATAHATGFLSALLERMPLAALLDSLFADTTGSVNKGVVS